MNHGIRLPYIAKPVINAQIMMRRRTIRRMIDFTRIIAKPARRLDGDVNVAVQHTGNNYFVTITKYISGCVAPIANQFAARALRQLLKKASVLRTAQPPVRSFKQRFGNKAPVIGGMRGDLVNKSLTILRNSFNKIVLTLHFFQQ